jgi:7-cyano-7-deazaguanine synthase in queuosine biosynthesis
MKGWYCYQNDEDNVQVCCGKCNDCPGRVKR